MEEILGFLLQIARLPLLPYVAISVSLAYLVLAGVLVRGERRKAEEHLAPPPGLF
jgi:hypothetical protein